MLRIDLWLSRQSETSLHKMHLCKYAEAVTWLNRNVWTSWNDIYWYPSDIPAVLLLSVESSSRQIENHGRQGGGGGGGPQDSPPGWVCLVGNRRRNTLKITVWYAQEKLWVNVAVCFQLSLSHYQRFDPFRRIKRRIFLKKKVSLLHSSRLYNTLQNHENNGSLIW